MNGRKSKWIRKRAEQLQVEWINNLLTDDADKVTMETLEQALPEQEYFYKDGKICLSFMNHRWVEKKLKKNNNLNLEKLIQSNA
jgi:hypothetical protein